jgi:hypothetical protein
MVEMWECNSREREKIRLKLNIERGCSGSSFMTKSRKNQKHKVRQIKTT